MIGGKIWWENVSHHTIVFRVETVPLDNSSNGMIGVNILPNDSSSFRVSELTIERILIKRKS